MTPVIKPVSTPGSVSYMDRAECSGLLQNPPDCLSSREDPQRSEAHRLPPISFSSIVDGNGVFLRGSSVLCIPPSFLNGRQRNFIEKMEGTGKTRNPRGQLPGVGLQRRLPFLQADELIMEK